jgi:hypothetical protein
MISITVIADADPILAALNVHQEAIVKLNTEHAKLVAEGLTDTNSQPVGAALMATYAAGEALMDTAPTTYAGLRAFEGYLLEDSMGPRMARRMIKYPSTVEGITFISAGDGHEGVDWLIAKRAAELDRAA